MMSSGIPICLIILLVGLCCIPILSITVTQEEHKIGARSSAFLEKWTAIYSQPQNSLGQLQLAPPQINDPVIIDCERCFEIGSARNVCKQSTSKCSIASRILSSSQRVVKTIFNQKNLDVYCSGVSRLFVNPETRDASCPRGLTLKSLLTNGYAEIISDKLLKKQIGYISIDIKNPEKCIVPTPQVSRLTTLRGNIDCPPEIHVYMQNDNKNEAVKKAIKKAINDGEITMEQMPGIAKKATKKTVKCVPIGNGRYDCYVKLRFKPL